MIVYSCMRKVNEAGIRLIKEFEGLRLKPYLCSAGVPTIGYGTTVYPDGKKVSLKDPAITEEQANHFLMHDVNKVAERVSKLLKVPVSDNEFAALVSFAYNVGVSALASSTLLRMLNSKSDKLQVADQFLRWNKVKGVESLGLTRRRQEERKLFLTQ